MSDIQVTYSITGRKWGEKKTTKKEKKKEKTKKKKDLLSHKVSGEDASSRQHAFISYIIQTSLSGDRKRGGGGDQGRPGIIVFVEKKEEGKKAESTGRGERESVKEDQIISLIQKVKNQKKEF